MGVLPLSTQFEGEPHSRPTALLVTAADKIVHGEVLNAPSVEVADLSDLMASHLMLAVKSSGAKPRRLTIFEPELVDTLASKMVGVLGDIEVIRGPIREVEK
ncbi:MAG: hypothetical protein AAFY88_21000, partial [Acidobacteriota bacterium]